MSWYADHQSLKTLVLGSDKSWTAINVSTVLSGTGTRFVFSGLALNTTEHPLSFHFVSPIVLSPTELAVVDFDCLVRTADFRRAAWHIVQHDPSTDFGPINDSCKTEHMLLLDSVSRKAVNDTVREEQNLYKVQVTLLKPSTVLN